MRSPPPGLGSPGRTDNAPGNGETAMTALNPQGNRLHEMVAPMAIVSFDAARLVASDVLLGNGQLGSQGVGGRLE